MSSRFYRWRRSGVWQCVLEALQALADAEGRVGWDLHFLDSTVVRAQPMMRRRDSLTLWVSDEAIAAWRAPPRTTPGGQARYSAVDSMPGKSP